MQVTETRDRRAVEVEQNIAVFELGVVSGYDAQNCMISADTICNSDAQPIARDPPGDSTNSSCISRAPTADHRTTTLILK